MILFSTLKGYELRTPTNEPIGKIKDIVVKKRNWQVKGFIFSEGMFDFEGDNFFPAELIKRVDFSEKAVLCYGVCREEELCGQIIEGEDIKLSDLLNRRTVYSEDKFEIGQTYDGVIYTHLSPWTLSKVLIGRGFMKRRSRLDTEKIGEISEDWDVFIGLKHLEVDREDSKELDDLRVQRQEVLDEQKIVEKRLGELSDIISRVEIKLEAYDIKIQHQKESIEEHEGTKDELSHQYKETKKLIRALKRQISRKEKALEELKKEIEVTKPVAEADKELTSKLRDLKKGRKELTAELKLLHKNLADDIKRRDGFQAHMDRLEEMEKELERGIDKNEDIIKAIKHDLRDRKREKGKATREFKKLEKRMSAIDDHINALLTPDLKDEPEEKASTKDAGPIAALKPKALKKKTKKEAEKKKAEPKKK